MYFASASVFWTYFIQQLESLFQFPRRHCLKVSIKFYLILSNLIQSNVRKTRWSLRVEPTSGWRWGCWWPFVTSQMYFSENGTKQKRRPSWSDIPEQCTTHKKNVFKSTGRRQEQWEGKHSAVREVCSWGLSKQICTGVVLSCWIAMKGKSPLMVGGLWCGGWAGQWRDDSESGGGGAAFNGFSLRQPSSRPPSPGSCSAALLQLSLRNCCRCFCHINLSYPPRKPLSNKTIQRGPQRAENSNTESAKVQRGFVVLFLFLFFTGGK